MSCGIAAAFAAPDHAQFVAETWQKRLLRLPREAENPRTSAGFEPESRGGDGGI